MTSFVQFVRTKRSNSLHIQRLLELSIEYFQQEQNNSICTLTSFSSTNASSTINFTKQLEKRIQFLLKQINKSKRNDSIQQLEQAILHKDSRTKCVLISK